MKQNNRNVLKRKQLIINWFCHKTIPKLLAIILWGWLIYKLFSVTFEEYSLKKHGIVTNAVITDTRAGGSKGQIKCYYIFTVNGNEYSGNNSDADYKIGDTIRIVYKKDNPEVNRDYKSIK